MFGARGRSADNGQEDESPVAGRDNVTLGRVAKWCIRHAECSMIIARKTGCSIPIVDRLLRSSTA